MAGGACFMRATVKQIGHISEWRPQRATGGGGEVEDGDRDGGYWGQADNKVLSCACADAFGVTLI